MKLSIIIPMYGVERYIDKCLNSCISQKQYKIGEDYEIICVDDGSLDNSALIAKGYQEKTKGLHIIHQKNQGLSGARNTGVNNSHGDYIWFVDSDDWIEHDSLMKIFPYLKDNLDLLEIQYRNVYEDGTTQEGEKGVELNGLKSGKEVMLMGGVHTAAPFTIYRSKFLKENSLYFVKGIYHEDVEFKPRTLLLAERVASCPDICYNYLQRTKDSITSVYKLKNGVDMLSVLCHLVEYAKPYEKDIRSAINNQISMWMNSVLLGIRDLHGQDYNSLLNSIKQSRTIFLAMIHSNRVKYKIEGLLLFFNVPLALWVHSKIR